MDKNTQTYPVSYTCLGFYRGETQGKILFQGRCKLKFIHFLFLDMRDMILGLRDLYNRNRYHAKQKLGIENPLFYMCLI